MTTLVLALGAPVVLVLLALLVIAVRTHCGGCPAHVRHAWLRAGRPDGGASFPPRTRAPVS